MQINHVTCDCGSSPWHRGRFRGRHWSKWCDEGDSLYFARWNWLPAQQLLLLSDLPQELKKVIRKMYDTGRRFLCVFLAFLVRRSGVCVAICWHQLTGVWGWLQRCHINLNRYCIVRNLFNCSIIQLSHDFSSSRKYFCQFKITLEHFKHLPMN